MFENKLFIQIFGPALMSEGTCLEANLMARRIVRHYMGAFWNPVCPSKTIDKRLKSQQRRVRLKWLMEVIKIDFRQSNERSILQVRRRV